MQARCILCKKPFNRKTSEDKLKCKDCQTPDKETPEWKTKLKKFKPQK